MPSVIHRGSRLDAWDDTSVTIDGQRIATGPDRVVTGEQGVAITVVDTDHPNATTKAHGYAAYKRGCRCEVCTAANSAYTTGYRAGLRKARLSA